MWKYNEPDITKSQEMEGWLSMKKRTFSAEFKAKVVLEVLHGEKELNIIAQENEIAPNQKSHSVGLLIMPWNLFWNY